MKRAVIGVHRQRGDIEPLAEAIPLDDLSLSGIAVEDDHPLGDRELLLRVANARAALLERATFIAVRYGFAVRDAAEAKAKCAPHIARWREVLASAGDAVEMTLKVAAAAPRARPNRRDFASGAEYLRALHEASAEVDPAFREAAEARLPSIRRRWSARDNASVEMAALVRRADVAAALAAGESLKRDYPHVAFLLSGPWPLEVFADDHE